MAIIKKNMTYLHGKRAMLYWLFKFEIWKIMNNMYSV